MLLYFEHFLNPVKLNQLAGDYVDEVRLDLETSEGALKQMRTIPSFSEAYDAALKRHNKAYTSNT